MFLDAFESYYLRLPTIKFLERKTGLNRLKSVFHQSSQILNWDNHGPNCYRTLYDRAHNQSCLVRFLLIFGHPNRTLNTIGGHGDHDINQ